MKQNITIPKRLTKNKTKKKIPEKIRIHFKSNHASKSDNFWDLSKNSLETNSYRKIKKNSELYKKIFRSINKIIKNCLKNEQNEEKFKEYYADDLKSIKARPFNSLIKFTQANLDDLKKNKKMESNENESINKVEKINQWIADKLETYNCSPTLISAYKCTDIFKLYSEDIEKGIYMDTFIKSILEYQFTQENYSKIFKFCDDGLDNSKPVKIKQPWSIFELLTLIKFFELIPEILAVNKFKFK